MSLVVTPRTGNSHEVGGEFPGDHLHLFVCRFPKDSCERRVQHLCLDAVRGYRVGHAWRVTFVILCGDTKGRCLVCSDDDANDTNQKGRRKTIWGFSVCGDVGDGDAGYN